MHYTTLLQSTLFLSATALPTTLLAPRAPGTLTVSNKCTTPFYYSANSGVYTTLAAGASFNKPYSVRTIKLDQKSPGSNSDPLLQVEVSDSSGVVFYDLSAINGLSTTAAPYSFRLLPSVASCTTLSCTKGTSCHNAYSGGSGSGTPECVDTASLTLTLCSS